MPLINCKDNLILTWSSTCVITNSTNAGTFSKTDTKLYVPIVTFSTQDNVKLLQQLESGFKRTINWSKYQSEPKTPTQDQSLKYLINLTFQGVNRPFVLLFENDAVRTGHTRYCLPTVKIKNYNVKIDGRNVFGQPINSDIKTYENIRKNATGQGDDYTTGCLLDYHYFKENYKMIAIDLIKEYVLDAGPRAIQQINFTGNLNRAGETTMFFILEEAKKTVLDFSQGTTKVL